MFSDDIDDMLRILISFIPNTELAKAKARLFEMERNAANRTIVADIEQAKEMIPGLTNAQIAAMQSRARTQYEQQIREYLDKLF